MSAILPCPNAFEDGDVKDLTKRQKFGGAEEDRTPDLRIANATLSRTELRPLVEVVLVSLITSDGTTVGLGKLFKTRADATLQPRHHL